MSMKRVNIMSQIFEFCGPGVVIIFTAITPHSMVASAM